MKFHVIGLPHTVTSKEYLPCAYTMKVFHFCKMMKSLGHTVIHYGGEGSNPECDEHVTIVTGAQREAWFGHNDWKKDLFDFEWRPWLEYWRETNAAAIREMAKRIEGKDFICLIGGGCQRAIADAFPAHLSVEYGVGYEGVFSKYRVFESFAWMHYIYGKQKQENGNYYDVVIPNYFDPADFPFQPVKKDYFLFVGRFTMRKAPHIAAEVCQAVGSKLIMAGQGVTKREPGKLMSAEVSVIGDHVEHVGTVNVEQRGKLMGEARALFVPTQYIGPFEGVAVEAMMCGTPVITTDWGAFSETVIEGVTGFRCRTFGEFVKATEKVDTLDRVAIREHAIRNYSLEAVKGRYQVYFERLMGLWGKGWYS